jgi:hypothetical protein
MKGAMAGAAMAIGIAIISSVAILVLAIGAEIRADGGAGRFVERLIRDRSFLDIVYGFAGALGSFSFWGAVLGLLVLTPRKVIGH